MDEKEEVIAEMRHDVNLTSNDGKTLVYSMPEFKNIVLKDPVLIAGFPGPGLVGSISVNYLIEKLQMKQIGCVESEFIIPGVIYYDGRLRHPFRLYSNQEGSLCVLVCEAPILIRGISSVLNLVMKWCNNNNVQEVLVLGGFSRPGLDNSKREPYIFSSINEDSVQKTSFDRKIITTYLEPTTFIGGIPGGLLSSSLANNIPCTALFIPSRDDLPDAEGAAIIIDEINKITKDEKLKVDTSQLRQEGENLKKRMLEFIESLRKEVSRVQKASGEAEPIIYG
ncbi:MAG TPA: PAC2 family protein [Nitrososphaeraceae archaeon]|nr:PAC2 family protein [Nitrososphaeraceae archaeon]